MRIKDLYKKHCELNTKSVGYQTFRERLQKGWSIEKSIDTPNQGIGGPRGITQYKAKWKKMKAEGLFDYSYTKFMRCIHNNIKYKELVKQVHNYLKNNK